MDRPARGGGVLIAIMSHLPVCLLHSQTDPDIITMKILFPTPLIFCVVYISPSSSASSQLALIGYLHSLFSSSAHPIVVTGDFNCPDINWDLLVSSTIFSTKLCDLVFDLQLIQLVDVPTHIKGTSWI